MTIFEMVFNLIGLVLGLTLVEVLSGLSRTFKTIGARALPAPTTLLGLWIAVDVSAFWGIAFEVRNLLTNLWQNLFVGVVLASVYYLAASFVFPDRAKSVSALDAHYFATKRAVIALVLACDVIVLTVAQLLGRSPSWWVIGFNAVYFSTALVTVFVGGRRTNVCLLAALLALMVIGFVAPW